MKTNLLFFSLLSAASLFVGCVEKVNLDIDTVQPKLVVDGLISDSLGEYTIKVNYSAEINDGYDNVFAPLPGAVVKVLDDAGNVFEFSEGKPGVYVKTMKGEPGKIYHLELTTPDGKHIVSEPEILRKAPAISGFSVEAIDQPFINNSGNEDSEKRLILKLNTNVADFSERPYLRWRMDGEYEYHEVFSITKKICYVKHRPDLHNLRIFDTHELAGDLLFDEPILNTLLNYRFSDKYCFHVYQYAIGKREYEYWRTVGEIMTRQGNLFDPPPGTVRGNLSNVDDPEELVAGYFSVSGVSYARHFVTPFSLGFYVEPRCTGFRNLPSECYNCLLLPNSTQTKPVYW